MITLHHGDCRDIMATMDASSVDAIVTDPPYGLAFMGKDWDHGVPGVEFWTEALRVAKPGAHLLAFGGTRTYHRLACAIEDAGWEIRDCVMWVYGSGFPKSHDVSKAIDKRGGVHAGFVEFRDAVKENMKRNGVSRAQLQDALGNFMLSHYLTAGSQPAVPNLRDYRIIRDTVGLGDEWDHLFDDEAAREVVGTAKTTTLAVAPGQGTERPQTELNITAPATDAARQWSGWGTALKPAWEPIIVARKPLCGTVAETVLRHGTGALNIDGCRAGARWPANVAHDGIMHEHGRYFYCAKTGKADRNDGCDDMALRDDVGVYNMRFDAHAIANGMTTTPRRNHHPTVKPTELMRYLVRLVTPPGGVVLDPFCGSGSTGRGAILEGMSFIGIDLDAEYLEIARRRINACLTPMEVLL